MRRALPALVAGALLLGACGGGDDTENGASAAATTAAPSAGATTVVVDPASVPAEPSAGCGGRSTTPPGETQVVVASGGADRAYAQVVPTAHDGDTPVALVVDFHGYSEGGPIHQLHTLLGDYGEEQGFVTVSPDSGYPVPRWDVSEGSRDLAMFGDLLDQLEADLCLDTNRLFVTGLSNGAFMTSALACVYSDRIAAFAPVAGVRDPEGCTFERPVPVIAFHGTADTFLPFDGGLGPSVADLPQPDGSGTLGDAAEGDDDEPAGPTVPETVAAWAARNGCDVDPAEELVADDVTLLAHPCPPGADAELYVVDGGGHTWPGSEFDVAIENIVGPVTTAIDANQLMWAFFQDHPLQA